MVKNNVKQPSITKSRIASSKGLQLICAFLTFLLDAVTLAILVINTWELKYLIFPIILFVLDLLFIFKVVFSNYRFSYAFNGILIHIGCVIAACGCSYVLTELLDERIVFITFALYAMPAVHLLQCIAALFNAWHSAHSGKLLRRIIAVVMSVLLVVCIGVYAKFLLTDGFFGQGTQREERTVVYALDTSGRHYIVKDVLAGAGNTVTVPETFNGLPVKGIDCMLFANEELSYVILDCASDVEFLNINTLAHVNENLSLETSKFKLDDFRNMLFSLALENSEMLHLANHITPSDLADDEVYVTFRYDIDTLELVGDDILPTWFGRKGATFDIHEHGQGLDYIRYSNVDSSDDLYWCAVNQKRLIFRWLYDDQQNDVSVHRADSSVGAHITFDKIYQVNIGEDNDDLFTIDAVYTQIETTDGIQPYKLATGDRILSLLESVPQRAGFDLAWHVGSDRHELTDLPSDLALLDQAGMSTLELHPVWDLRAPVIDLLSADGKTQDHGAIYGNNVLLEASATPPHESISLKYEWHRDGVLGEGNTYTITNIYPQDAGDYTLTVTAYAATTSLTKAVSKSITVGFIKRELRFDWSLPEDTVYAAEEKPLSVQPDMRDVINNDEISTSLSQNSVRDAGDYNIVLTLTGDTNTKYRIADGSIERSLTITPHPLSVTWGSERSFEYDGEPHAPTASAMGLKDDGAIDVQVSGHATNAGTSYTAQAKTSNKNYALLDTEMAYEITPKPITEIIWHATTSFVYNAKEQYPKIQLLEDVIEKDRTKVLAAMIYEGKRVNAGKGYVVVARLPENSNYVFNCNTTTTFDITPKALSVTLTDKTVEYSGLPYDDFTFTASGLEGNDKAEEVFGLDYYGEATTAVNVRDEAYVINAQATEKGKFGNYAITITQGALRITPKTLNVYIDAAEKVYDGHLYPTGSHTFTYEGLASTDTIGSVLTLTYQGDATTNVSAGTWDINARAEEGTKYGNYLVIIHPATLTIHRAPLTVTAVGGQKTYDGTAFDGFSFTVEGLVNNEQSSALGEPVYGGTATTNANAGTHTLTVRFNENSMNRNYAITCQQGTVQIDKRELTVTAVGGSKTYDGQIGSNSFSFTADGLAPGDRPSSLGKATYGGPATTDKNVGDHKLTVQLPENAATNNYDITYIDGLWSIEPKDITVAATQEKKVYDSKTTTTFGYSVAGLVAGDTKELLGTPTFGGTACSAVDAGDYTITVTLPGHSNYHITKYTNATLTITPAPLTLSAVAQNKTYDGVAGGSFSYTVNGLVGNDTEALLGKITFEGTAVNAVNAGIYTLEATTAANLKNYEIICLSADFEITRAPLTVSAIAQEKIFDGSGFAAFDFAVTGLAGGETKEMLGAPVFDGDALTATDAGIYTLTLTLPRNQVTENYDIIYESAVCTITPKALTVTAVATDRVYAADVTGGTFDFTVEGLIESHSKDALVPLYGGDAVSAVDVGTYTLTVALSESEITRNYEITYIPDEAFVISAEETQTQAETQA